MATAKKPSAPSKAIKKAAPRRAAAATKTAEAALAEVEAYLAAVPQPAHDTLQHIRSVIRAAAPKSATEGLSYRIPAFHYKGALVAYAAFKRHCSLFPMQSSLIEQYAAELAPYKTARGTIQFPPDQPLPDALVKKVVKARVARNTAKQES